MREGIFTELIVSLKNVSDKNDGVVLTATFQDDAVDTWELKNPPSYVGPKDLSEAILCDIRREIEALPKKTA
jgi:hypothetical protein